MKIERVREKGKSRKYNEREGERGEYEKYERRDVYMHVYVCMGREGARERARRESERERK